MSVLKLLLAGSLASWPAVNIRSFPYTVNKLTWSTCGGCTLAVVVDVLECRPGSLELIHLTE